MDCTEKSDGSFVVTGGYCPVILELFKEVFDQMPRLVERLVIVSLNFSVGFRRYNDLFSGQNQRLNHPRVGVISFVGEQNWGFKITDQMIGSIQIAGLPAGQKKTQRIAQCIAGRVDLGA